MDTPNRIPYMSREAAIERLEQWASKTNMTQEEEAQYEREWKAYNDFINTLDFARQEGLQEGRQKGLQESRQENKLETARKLKELGVVDDIIMKAIGLSKAEMEKL